MRLPIKLGVVGAGLFARDAHLPNLLALEKVYQIVAVYSRSEKSAHTFAEKVPYAVDIYHDMAALLAREDLDAVDIVLPIAVTPAAIEMALKAGKHVISEKPMAPTVEEGRRLLELYAGSSNKIWMVAENWRYAGAVQRAKDALDQGDIGRPLLASWAIHVQMTPENKYYHTAWRRNESFPGGFLLDGGVHHAAAWRFLLGEVKSVSAITAQIRDDLPPADTMSAALQFQSGLLGTYGITYAGSAPEDTTLNIIGEKGAIHVNRDLLTLITHTSHHEFRYDHPDGIYPEFVAFAEAILNGKPHLNTPQEGLNDVALIEAMLKSAETGQRVRLT